VDIAYARRRAIDPQVLQELFVDAWEGKGKRDYTSVLDRSFTWITAHDGERLVGFVNIAWDGGVHFFLLDTTVDPAYRHRQIGTRLVTEALEACRGHGEWVHVDSSRELMDSFYLRAGFRTADAGLAWVGG
jgi:ribosomal protein S18 acetylase RimI-like enzyme